MVTGYYTNVEYDVLVRRAKKIFYLIVIATIIYLPLNILVHWAQGNMNFWLSEIQKPEILFKISFRIFERRAGQGIQQPDEKIAFPK